MKSSDIACTAKFAHLAGIYPKRAQAEKEADAKNSSARRMKRTKKARKTRKKKKKRKTRTPPKRHRRKRKRAKKRSARRWRTKKKTPKMRRTRRKTAGRPNARRRMKAKKKTPKRAGADWNARVRRRSLQVQRRASVRRLPRNWRFRRAFRATRRLRYWPPLPRARRAAARIWRSGWRRFPARTSGWKALNPTVRAHSRRTFWLRAEKRAANAYPLNRSKDDNVNDGRQSPTARHLERSLYSRSTDRRHAATGHRNDYACRRPITARRAVGPQRGWRLCVVQKDGEGWFAATGGDSGGRGRRAQYPRLGGRVSDGRV